MGPISRAVAWLVAPWMGAATASARARAARIALVAGALAAMVLPAMVLHYGADGWMWDLTLSVLLCTPLGILGADQLVPNARGARRLLVLFAGMCAGLFLGYAAVLILPLPSNPGVHVLARDFRRSLTIFTPVTIAALLVGSFLWYRAEAFRLEGAVATASFAALKQQLQPHFLFNALNSLKELIADDPARAGDAVQRLADLYRLILAASRDATIPLAEEVAIVESYLEVERMRYGDRLRYRIDVPRDLGEAHVPSLLVQTLVENAVKHGVCKAREGGEVAVRAARSAAGIAIEVRNTGAPYRRDAPPVPGAPAPIGLANARERLRLMYGAASELTLDWDERDGTRARFIVSGARMG